MTEKNKFDLTRVIPESIKREVRQRCGFGCVFCGGAIYQYEHFAPTFAEATEHAAEGITLLCPSCHEKKTKGFTATSSVITANVSPFCRKQGFSFERFDIGADAFPEIVIGALRARNVKTLIRLYGDEILSIRPPDTAGSPFLVNAWLCDIEGNEVLKIVDNEWQTRAENWDVIVVGPRISIRRGPGDVVLVLRAEPPERLIIERINMFHRGVVITCQEGQDLTINDRGKIMHSSGMEFDGCQVGIDVSNSGAAYGVGGGLMSVRSMKINSVNSTNTGRVLQSFRAAHGYGKVGRNVSCPCGSGLKFKKCHGLLS